MRGLTSGAAGLAILLLATGFNAVVARADGDDSSYARPETSNQSDSNADRGSSFSFFGSDDKDKSAATGDGKADRAIDSYRPGSVDQIAWDTMRQKIMALARSNGHGLVDDPSIVGHVQGILDRIVESSPEPAMIVRATVRASGSFHAEAYPGGLVSVPIGLLRDLESDDELAFVLAHELAHVLFRHHESDWLKNAQYKAFVGLAFAEDVAEQVEEYTGKSELRKKLKKGSAGSRGLYEVTDHALNPAWNRDQENAADLVGFDLVVRAGFNPTAALRFFEKLEQQELRQQQERMAAEREREHAAKVEVEEAVEKKNFFSALTTAVSHGVSQVGDGLKDSFGRKHDPADQRLAALNTYRQQVYVASGDKAFKRLRFAKVAALPWKGWRDATDVKSDGWFLLSFQRVDDALLLLDRGQAQQAAGMMNDLIEDRTKNLSYHRLGYFRVRKSQGRESSAWKNLELAMQGGTASLPIYEAAIDFQLAKGNKKKAIDLVDRARSRLDDPVSLLPVRITVLAKLDREKEMNALLLECRSHSAELHKLCKKAIAATEAADS